MTAQTLQDAPVLREDRGNIRLITLNRPDRRNAIDMPLRMALAEELETAMADDRIRVIVMTGAGKGFCSGGDISTMQRQPPEQTVPRAQAAQRVIRAIWQGPKPVIAAVEGAAFGAGISLAVACDRVVAAEGALFSTAFMGVGLSGDMGIFASLPARVGLAKARQLMLLPQKLSGRQACDIGIADAVVETGTALERALEDARLIAQAPPLAIREMKSLLAAWPSPPMAVLDLEVQAQSRLFDTADFAEGIAAFREKRPAKFSGR